MLVTFKQEVIEQYSSFQTQEGFAGHFGSSLCKQLTKALAVENITIIIGPNNGEDVFLPRISLIPSDANQPFDFKQLHFPARVCFAMSINKAQGQRLKVAGLYLQAPCFSQGQFYVGCSGELARLQTLYTCTRW